MTADATYQPKVYKKQGGAEQVVASGGTITVESGGIIALETGADITHNGTSLVDEIAAMSGMDTTEFGYINGSSTAVTASKVVVADANKDITAPRNLTLGTNGATGAAAGSLIVKDGANPGATATLTYADVALIDGLTAGTVAASQAVTVTSDKDVGTFRNLTISGNLVTGSTTLTEAELGVLDGVTVGTNASSKVVTAGTDGYVGAATFDGTLTLGVNGVGGVAGSLVVADGANPGASVTITKAELDAIDGAAAGSVARSKAIVSGAANAPVIDFAAIVPGTEITGSLISTGSTWVAFTAVGGCGGKLLLENQADTGEFATWRMRARANNTTVSGDGGSSIGTTTCIDASASAQASEYGNLRAVNACVQPNALNQTVDATNIVTALYGRVDRTGTSVGRTWVLWVDTHQETKSDASDYLARFTHYGTVANDGLMTIYSGGRLPVLINFEDVDSSLITAAASGTLTSTHKIAVRIGGDVRYLLAGTVA